MARYYYARECRYGLNVVWENSDGSTDRLPGTIHRFKTSAARDAWVDADEWDGNYHREAVTRAQVETKIRQSEASFGRVTWEGGEAGLESLWT